MQESPVPQPRRDLIPYLLMVVLIVALALRLYRLDWDEGHHVHPDERWICMVAPTIRWPEDLGDLLNPRRSTLNPLWVPNEQGGQVRNFAYGHLPLYLMAFFGHMAEAIGRAVPALASWQRLGTYDGIQLVGRFLSALFDTATVYLVYAIGRRVFDRRVGLIAAGLSAITVMHVQLAHFATFDVITTFFVVLALYQMLRLLQGERHAGFWAAVSCGWAVASKFSAAPLLAVLVLAYVLRAVRLHRADVEVRSSYLVREVIARSALGLLIAFCAFFVVSPFAVLDVRLYLKQIIEQGGMVRGVVDWPFTRQYRYTPAYIYPVVQQLRWGMGWPLGVVAFLGFAWLVVKQAFRPRGEELVLLGWAVPYFLLTGGFMVKFMRYMLPLLPLITVMGVGMLFALRRLWGRYGRWVTGGLVGVALLGTAIYTLAFMRIYTRPHTWIQASQWIYEHVPDGSVLAVEHWDDHLPLALREPGASPAAHGYRQVELPMYDPDTPAKYTLLKETLRQVDYIVISTNRLYRTIPRLPERYPISTRYYELLFSGQLGFERVVEFTSYPGIGPWEIVDDDADESFTVYDHPKPIIFAKVRDLSDAEWDALFAKALATTPIWDFGPGSTGWPPWNMRRPGEDVGATEEKEARNPDLLLDQPVDELPVVDDFAWNRWAEQSTPVAILVWWLVLAALGVVTWPIAFAVFQGLRDRGYLFSRAVGLLLLGYFVWLPASLRWLPNTLGTTYLALLLLIGISVLLLRRYRWAFGAWLREHRRLIVGEEVLFSLAFLAFVGIRILNPDLWHPWQGGEKLMDIAYLNACLKSAYLPPFDPYYAHGYLNYYYYGQFLLSVLVRLTGIRPTIAFNLAVPTLFALTVGHTFSIGQSLVSDRRRSVESGIWAVLMVAFLGNLANVGQFLVHLAQIGGLSTLPPSSLVKALGYAVVGLGKVLGGKAPFPRFDYWAPSRVIPYTINEFPYWSFLFADLHPHMIAIPFTMVVIALAVSWVVRTPPKERGGRPADLDYPLPKGEWHLVWRSLRYWLVAQDWGGLVNWGIWAIALGALLATNTWDWPTYAGLSFLAVARVLTWRHGGRGIFPAVLMSGVLIAASWVLYLPFFRSYHAFASGVGVVHDQIAFPLFFTVWGLFLFLAASLVVYRLGEAPCPREAVLRLIRLVVRRGALLPRLVELHERLVRPRAGYVLALAALLVGMALVVVMALGGAASLGVTLLLFVGATVILLLPYADRRVWARDMLFFTALLVLAGIQVFYLRDFLAGGEYYRMNTIFKFGMQIWVLMGLACGAAFPELWDAVDRWSARWSRRLWKVAVVLMIGIAALFLPLGTASRVADRFPNARPPVGTLDGIAFMEVGCYAWPDDAHPICLKDDAEAIRWLWGHVPGTPVIAEAALGYYREFGCRVASLGGYPNLLGHHQSEQRYADQVGERSADAQRLFTSPDLGETLAVIEKLRVGYIYIGPLERIYYGEERVAKFDRMVELGQLEVVFSNAGVTIYRVLR